MKPNKMLKVLAVRDRRSMADETAWLVEQEYARRYSQPNSGVTVEEAIKAGHDINCQDEGYYECSRCGELAAERPGGLCPSCDETLMYDNLRRGG